MPRQKVFISGGNPVHCIRSVVSFLHKLPNIPPWRALAVRSVLWPADTTRGGRSVGAKYSRTVGIAGVALYGLALPALALAQNQSPFLTGATSLETNILAWMTPIAIILVMALGAMAMANRISWGWCIAAILGIAIVFGAPQIVIWVQGMFGV